ncbi:unnamed protein product [Closterium sp. NIES-54]
MENLVYKDWKAENEAKIGVRFGEVKSSGLEHVELPLELRSGNTTTRQSSLVNWGEEAKDAEEEEEESLHVPAAEEEGRGKRRIQAPNRLTYEALGKPAKSALAGEAMMVGDDEESEYEEFAFTFFSPVEMPETREVMLKLQDKFKCKALGDVYFYLGLHIERDVEERCMRVHQRKYLEALAAKFGQSEGHVATPFPSGFKCVKGPEEESVGEEERHRFHSLVGSLMYAAVNTRPDVAFATGQLARIVQCPNEEQVAAGIRVAKCFLCIRTEDMTSVGGFIFCVGGGPTAWESKKQVDQALSSVESEYMALFRAVREIVWQRRLLAELGEEKQGPTPLYGDSQCAIALAKNPVLHGLTKHMRVKWHWTRSMVAAGEVELRYVKMTGQPADMMTKRLVEQ